VQPPWSLAALGIVQARETVPVVGALEIENVLPLLEVPVTV
jgi:hypothetical protein